jgi:hypothetical protein
MEGRSPLGLERLFQAIPADSTLVETAKADHELGEILGLACLFFQDISRGAEGPPSPARERLGREVSALLAQDPALATQNVDVDKRWDQLHFLLSASRRGEHVAHQDALFDMAIQGEAPIADHVLGSQGYPLRYTSPSVVASVAEAFEPLDVAALHQHYDLVAMEARGVYKAFAGRDSPDDWRYLSTLIEKLRAFYLSAARMKNAVLVHTD